MDSDAKFLAVKNWDKYQRKLKNGRERRDWIAVQTRLEEDSEFLRLNFYQRSVLQGIWRIRGATGKNVPDDPQYIRRFLAMSPQECSCLIAALELLKSYGWLVPCNQQICVESATQDKIQQDNTIKPPKAPRKQKAFAGYTEAFESFWALYPKTNGSKHDAFRAWSKAGLESWGAEIAVKSLKSYLDCPKWQDGYVPHAATWINRKMWEVEPSMGRSNGNGQQAGKRDKLREAMERVGFYDNGGIEDAEHLRVERGRNGGIPETPEATRMLASDRDGKVH